MADDVPPKQRNKEISNELRKIIYYQLIAMAKDDGHLKNGSYDVVAQCHNVAPRQVSQAYREMATKIKAYVESGDNANSRSLHRDWF